MIRNEHGAITLSADETNALAMLVVVHHLEDVEEWLDWEDLPLLDADGFNQVVDAIRDQASAVSMVLTQLERATDTDARYLRSEVLA